MSPNRLHLWLFILALLVVASFPAGQSLAQEPNLEALWSDLADADAGKAYRAIWAMALAPEKTVPFLKDRLRAATSDRKQIDKLVRELGNETFAVREKAIAELELLSGAAEETLKQALLEKPHLETKRRIEMALARMSDPAGSAALVRQARALEVLELARTDKAKKIIKVLAEGNAAARSTQRAQAAHDRLTRQANSPDIAPRKTDEYGDPLPAGALARLGTIRMQIGKWATITPDGKTLVTASDNWLCAWDLETGKSLDGFPQPKDWPESGAITISPDGQFVAVAYNRAYFFDILEFPGGRLLHRQADKKQTFESTTYSVGFAKDRKTFVVTGPSDKHLWEKATGKNLGESQSLTLWPARNYLKFGVKPNDGRRLAISEFYNQLRVWDVDSGKMLHDLGDQKTSIFAARVNSDGSILASFGPGPSTRLWNGITGKLIKEIPLAGSPVHGEPAPSYAFSPDGSTLATLVPVRKGDYEQQIQMWNLKNLDQKPRIITPPNGASRLENFTPDGKSLLWRVASSYRLLDATTGKDRHGWASRGAVYGVAWSPDGKQIATVTGEDGFVSLWDAAHAKLLYTFAGPRNSIGTVLFSPDSTMLVSCGGDKDPAMLWDTATGAKKFEMDATKLLGAFRAGFSHDSKSLFTHGLGGNGIFDVTKGKAQGAFNTDRTSTWNAAFSADGRFVAVGIDSVSMFDLKTGKKTQTVKSHQCVAQAFSNDGRTLVILNNGQRDNLGDVVLWDILTGQQRARIALPKAYFAYGRLTFSPNGRMLAVNGGLSGPPNLFQVWDLATQKQLGPFPGHLDAVSAVAFSPDSERIATASWDGTVLIHNVTQK